MLKLLVTLPLGNTPEPSWFPYLVYAAPNVLFTLISFFLLFRPEEYKAYTSLYLAGKTTVIGSILGWAIFSVRHIFPFIIPVQKFGIILLFVLVLSILDMGSLVGSFLLKRKINRKPAPEAETGEIVEGDMVPEGRDGS
ncbi:MAG: hypothetical protein LBP32_02970 [Spirochaetaceae bacterium]|jgi:hypothetical protein|nr:hypothetical protein [Spirochaetaceae bacterium]